MSACYALTSLPRSLWMCVELPHGSRMPPESSDAMNCTLHALPGCLAYRRALCQGACSPHASAVCCMQMVCGIASLTYKGTPDMIVAHLWQDVSLTACAPCRRQQAAQALLPLCGGPPQLRGAVPGQGLPGRHHGHAPLALLLQARRRGAASAAQAPALRITAPETLLPLPPLHLEGCLQTAS